MTALKSSCVVGALAFLLLIGAVSATDGDIDARDEIELAPLERKVQDNPSINRAIPDGLLKRSLSSPDIRAPFETATDELETDREPSASFDILTERHIPGTGSSSTVVRGGLGEPGEASKTAMKIESLRVKTVSWNLNHKLPSIQDVEELVSSATEDDYEVVVIGYQECMDGCLPPWTEDQRNALRGLCDGQSRSVPEGDMTEDFDMLSCLHHKALTGRYFRVAHSQLGCCKEMGLLAKRYHGYARVEVWVRSDVVDVSSLEEFIRDPLNKVGNVPTFDALRRPMHMAKWVTTADIALEVEAVSKREGDIWEARFSYIPSEDGFDKVSKAATGAMVKLRPDMAPLCFVNAHFPSTRMGENVETKSLRARNDAARQVQRDILENAFGGQCGFVVIMGDLNYRLDFRSHDDFTLSYAERCVQKSSENQGTLLSLRKAVLDDVRETMSMSAESDDESASTSSDGMSASELRTERPDADPMMELFQWHDELHLMFNGRPETPPRPPPSDCALKENKGSLLSGLVGLVASKNTKQRKFLGVKPQDMVGLRPFDALFRLVPVSPRCPPTFCKNTNVACAAAIRSGYSDGLDSCYQGPGMSALAHGHVLPAWTDRVLYKSSSDSGFVVEDGAVMECPIGSVRESEKEEVSGTLSVSDHTPVVVDFRIATEPNNGGTGESNGLTDGPDEAGDDLGDGAGAAGVVDDGEDIE